MELRYDTWQYRTEAETLYLCAMMHSGEGDPWENLVQSGAD